MRVIAPLGSDDPQEIGPYRLSGVLGRGGLGQVFLGRSADGQRAAVKIIRADLAADREFRRRFGQEVAAAQKVSGTFTAVVVDADPDGPVPWLATAYVAGPSLDEAVHGDGPLPVDRVLELAAGLAEGLVAIHAADVVHRDLKPSNVLLTEAGPRIIDFGISPAAGTDATPGVDVGSPAFMSPERALGHFSGPPSDIFSLGAVLTFAATGEGPFGSGSSAALTYRLVNSPARLELLPAELRKLVASCLAKDPDDRPTARRVLAQVGSTGPLSGWPPEPAAHLFTGSRSPAGTDAANGSELPVRPGASSVVGLFAAVPWRRRDDRDLQRALPLFVSALLTVLAGAIYIVTRAAAPSPATAALSQAGAAAATPAAQAQPQASGSAVTTPGAASPATGSRKKSAAGVTPSTQGPSAAAFLTPSALASLTGSPAPSKSPSPAASKSASPSPAASKSASPSPSPTSASPSPSPTSASPSPTSASPSPSPTSASPTSSAPSPSPTSASPTSSAPSPSPTSPSASSG